MSSPVLSILTPAVLTRLDALGGLCVKIERLSAGLPVEHLVLIDNKKRTVGEKRDALLRMSQGDYVAFVDDDDDISDEYVSEILNATRSGKDVITFSQRASVNGTTAEIEFKLGNANEPFHAGVVKRNAWHVCAWKRWLAIQSHFPAVNYGEDWAFAEPLCNIATSSEHIDKVLHFYRHDAMKTEAPPP